MKMDCNKMWVQVNLGASLPKNIMSFTKTTADEGITHLCFNLTSCSVFNSGIIYLSVDQFFLLKMQKLN